MKGTEIAWTKGVVTVSKQDKTVAVMIPAFLPKPTCFRHFIGQPAVGANCYGN